MDLPPTRAQLPGADEMRRKVLEDLEWRMSVCQVIDPDIPLPCPNQESGGNRCEVVEPHPAPEGCAISEHTINHGLRGNGNACWAIDPPLKPKEDA